MSSPLNSTSLVVGNGCPTVHGVLLSPYWVVILSMICVSGLAIAWNYGKRWAKAQAHKRAPPALAQKLFGRPIAYSGVVGTVEAVSEECEVIAAYTVQESTVRVVVQGFTTRYPDCDGAVCYIEGVHRLKEDPRDAWRGALKPRVFPLIDTGEPLPFNASEEIAPGQWKLEGQRSDFDRMRVGARITLRMRESSEVQSLLLPAPGYARLMMLLNCAHLIYMGATLLPEYTQSTAQSQYTERYNRDGIDAAWSPLRADGSAVHSYPSSWLRYEQLYVRALNSGALTVGVTSFLATERVQMRVEQMELQRYCKIALGFFMPVILTHALPALIVFPQLIAGLAAMWALYWFDWNQCFARQDGDGDGDGAQSRRHVIVEQTAQRCALLIGLLLVQIAVHYAVLMFDAHDVPMKAADWTNIVSSEWEMRSTSCYFASLSRSANHMLSFLSWL